MSAVKGLGACLVALLLWVTVGPGARAEVMQSGDVRVSFTGSLTPHTLPRKGSAPITVRLVTRISTTDGSDPPPLQRLELAVNRNGRLDPGAVPTCRESQIQPASTAGALETCGAAKVGEGSFNASVGVPGQAPFPSQGVVTVFNGVDAGKPALLLHIYGSKPVPTSLTIPLRIGHAGGQFGIALTGRLPSVEANVGFVTGLVIRLDGSSGAGNRHFLSAGCPAPHGFAAISFPLARGGFAFKGGRSVTVPVPSRCRPR